MRTIFRFTRGAAVAFLVTGLGVAAANAQNNCDDSDGQAAVYTKFTELYPKTDLESRKAAIDTAKSFLEKYGSCEVVKEQNDYFKSALPALEKAYNDIIARQKRQALFKRFDDAVKADNADEAYAAGKELLADQPDNFNVLLTLGLIGASQSNQTNNFKFTNDGLQYARLALSKIDSGAAKFDKPGGKAGVFQYEMTKAEATGDLKYAIAYLSYYGRKDKATALPLYYELAQGAFKDDPRVYGTIGDYYIEQRRPIAEQIRVKIEEQKGTTSDERKIALEDEIKKLVALFNGYNERILDAFGRAYKVAKDTPANKAYRDNLYRLMQDVYKNRFPEKDTGLDAFIAQTVAKPFPNPTSEVQPVEDAEPVTATTSSTPAPAPNGRTANTRP
ncbi:MAG TPA: hypothetical protein PKD26_07605 [Pyrinomonadaceae bacterium]|nr:hypothetical protein [Pyrinomonadaceae bacterium]